MVLVTGAVFMMTNFMFLIIVMAKVKGVRVVMFIVGC